MAYNILIVDDSTPMRAVIKKIIKASGFDVGGFFEAVNGQEALKVLNEEWLDLVLTDYNMPDMNGLELIEEMKKNDKVILPISKAQLANLIGTTPETVSRMLKKMTDASLIGVDGKTIIIEDYDGLIDLSDSGRLE